MEFERQKWTVDKWRLRLEIRGEDLSWNTDPILVLWPSKTSDIIGFTGMSQFV